MKKKLSSWLQSSLGSLCMLVFGIVLLIHPDLGSAAVAAVISWVLIAAGALWLLISIATGIGLRGMLPGMLVLVAGLYLLNNPLSLASLLGLCLGIYIGVQGIFQLMDALAMGKGWEPFRLIYALALLVLGTVLILFPLSTSRFVMTACGIGMVICAGVNLLLGKKPDKPDVVDAAE